MKGFTGLEIAIMFISAVLVFIVILGVFGYTKNMTAGMCEFCMDMVDNYITLLKPGWINPCVQVMRCCDESIVAGCNSQNAGGTGTTTTLAEAW